MKDETKIFEKYRLKQSIQELERKAKKAYRYKGQIWTVEDIDLAKKEAAETGRKLNLEWAKDLDY